MIDILLYVDHSTISKKESFTEFCIKKQKKTDIDKKTGFGFKKYS